MAKCGDKKRVANPAINCGAKPVSSRVERYSRENGPLAWFGNMIQNCYEYASAEKAKGRRIVGIMCEYTPRE